MNFDNLLQGVYNYAGIGDVMGFPITPSTSMRLRDTEQNNSGLAPADRNLQTGICGILTLQQFAGYACSFHLPLLVKVILVSSRFLLAGGIWNQYSNEVDQVKKYERNAFCAAQLVRGGCELLGYGYLLAIPDILLTIGCMLADPKGSHFHAFKNFRLGSFRDAIIKE